MGRSRQSKNSKKLEIPSKPLKYGYLATKTLIEEVKVTDILITWIVENYSTIAPNRMYKADFEEHNHTWQFFLNRQLPYLFICIITDDILTDIMFRIRKRNGNFIGMCEDYAIKRSNDFYWATFDERNCLAQSGKPFDDILIVEFMYTTRPHENTIFLTPGLKECSQIKTFDVDILFTDLKSLYLTARSYDFILSVGYVKFKVHKLILRKHSKYLARMMKEDPDWKGDHFEIITNPIVMHKVLIYLYSGELNILDDGIMKEVYGIACVLEIGSLREICLHFLKSTLSVDNALSLYKLANFYNQTDFEREIVLFLSKQPDSVRNTKDWTKVIAGVLKYMPEDVCELNDSLKPENS